MVKLYMLIVLIALTAVVVASRWLPWWGAAIVIPGTILFFIWLTVWLIKRWFRNAMTMGVEEAARPMDGGTITIHDCHTVPEPVNPFGDDDEEPGTDDDPSLPDLTPVRWIAMDMTVRPNPEPPPPDPGIDPDEIGEPGTWEPTSFTLVPADAAPANPRRDGLLKTWVRLQGTVLRTERLSDNGEEILADTFDLDGDGEAFESVAGPARVRVTVGLPRDLTGAVKLRYLLYDLAEFTLPAG